MSQCPSDFALERHLAGLGSADDAEHVAGCERCTARLSQMRAAGDEFHREVLPQTTAALSRAAARPRPPTAPLFAGLLLAAAAGIALIVRAPDADVVHTKGALALSVFAADGSGVHELADGERVAPGSALRFRIQTSTECRLWLFSVDAAGQTSQLFPSAPEPALLRPSRAEPLPGGAVLDDHEGPERIFAVCSPVALRFADIAASAARLTRSEQALRDARALDDLPPGTLQESLLVEKRR